MAHRQRQTLVAYSTLQMIQQEELKRATKRREEGFHAYDHSKSGLALQFGVDKAVVGL